MPFRDVRHFLRALEKQRPLAVQMNGAGQVSLCDQATLHGSDHRVQNRIKLFLNLTGCHAGNGLLVFKQQRVQGDTMSPELILELECVGIRETGAPRLR